MEDAHIAVLNLGNNADTAMFGVFDGHGGRYAVHYACYNDQLLHQACATFYVLRFTLRP